MATRLEEEERKLEEAAAKQELKTLELQGQAEPPALWQNKQKPGRFKLFLAKVRAERKKKVEDKRQKKIRDLLERERRKTVYLALEELRIVGQLLKFIAKGGDIEAVAQGIQMQLGAKLDSASPQVRDLIGLVEYLKHKREDRKVEVIKHKVEDAIAHIQAAKHPSREPMPVNFGNLLEKARRMMEAEEKGVNKSEPKVSLESTSALKEAKTEPARRMEEPPHKKPINEKAKEHLQEGKAAIKPEAGEALSKLRVEERANFEKPQAAKPEVKNLQEKQKDEKVDRNR